MIGGVQTVMALVWSQKPPLPKKRQKVVCPKQNIALFLHSSTMAVAPLK